MIPNCPPRGFTLIELLIVVAVVAVLAMVAYPSYQDQIRKARRADAQAVLMEAAQFMERIYSESACYNNPGPDGVCNTDDDASPVLPYTKSPIDGAETYYAIAFPAGTVTATAFTIRATPAAGSQAGTGNLEIDNLGQKRWDENADGDFADAGEDDWNKG